MGRRCGVVLFLAFGALSLPAQAIVVISQVYGGGGNSGATYKNDFIELFNADTVAVSLAGWSVQYTSMIGSTWQETLLTGSIQPGHFLLIQEATGVGGAINLPTPDLTGSIAMSSTAGKVALRSNSQLLTGACPMDASIVDFVGYGSGTTCFEGAGPTSSPSNLQAAARIDPCVDTDDNPADFTAANAPTPRNFSTAPVSCKSIGFAVLQFPAVLDIPACQNPLAQPVYGQVYVAGATDTSASSAPGMLAQVGFGPSGSDPATNGHWVWFTAIPNPGWDFSQNNDEYQQGLVAHSSGLYDYAYRWSYNNQAFVYSDKGPEGTTNGYSTTDAGKLTVDGGVIFCDRFDY
jgi:hypothetical protein